MPIARIAEVVILAVVQGRLRLQKAPLPARAIVVTESLLLRHIFMKQGKTEVVYNKGGDDDMAELTEKQKRFADYYIESGNATEAAVKAGYSEKTARFIGAENLTKPNIIAYVDKILGAKDKERIASQDEVLEFLTSVMRGEVIEKIPVLVGGGMQELMENKPAVQVRKSAAELLGKRYRLFTENVNVSGNMGVTIVNDIPRKQ
jgi:phage terminase small subunit